MFFIAACLFALALPWLLNRKRQRKTRMRTRVFSTACLRSYAFWLVFVIGIVSAGYLWEALKLAPTPRIFPLWVSSVMLGLSFLICCSDFFRPQAQKAEETITREARRHVVVYSLILLGVYFAIQACGFYSACFLGVLLMTAYGVFCVGRTPVTAAACAKVGVFSACCLFIEYCCFGLLLRLQPPQGMLL